MDLRVKYLTKVIPEIKVALKNFIDFILDTTCMPASEK